ncbi:NAD(P)-binding protein [Collybia nuda]|uniref:NAD(P)-binding protein n=1 Tax=Collybia nuda TaxID=64659 RepID=A0A9P6CGM9_9AGAR|nr:NAD(P)-binding protein [Collybia nuda]
MLPQKVVICGAGFLGSNIARTLVNSTIGPERHVQLSSRNPQKIYSSLRDLVGAPGRLLPPVILDITKPDTMSHAFEGADAVVSLVGIMEGTKKQFEDVQWKGSENVAHATKSVGAKLIHFSAITANPESNIPYVRTKGLAEISALRICPDATIIRPSLIFGPGDNFFNRFSSLTQFLPFLPVFGGGTSRFQPVYVGDIAQAVEILTRNNKEINKSVSGTFIEAGGPEIFTYRELMQLILKYNHRSRAIVSFPFQIGLLQGMIFEMLPKNPLTVTRAQIEQLKSDNVVNLSPPPNHKSFKLLVERHSAPLSSLDDILPTYL